MTVMNWSDKRGKKEFISQKFSKSKSKTSEKRVELRFIIYSIFYLFATGYFNSFSKNVLQDLKYQ